jgi:hypothetical protein
MNGWNALIGIATYKAKKTQAHLTVKTHLSSGKNTIKLKIKTYSILLQKSFKLRVKHHPSQDKTHFILL